MAPVYKLTYYDFMGTSESIRYMLTYGRVNYENVTVNQKTTWPSMKQNVPFHKLPMLEYEGKVLNQPLAIARFLGKKLNLFGTDDITNAQMDTVAETVYEFWHKVLEYFRETDSTRKMQYKKALETEICPVYLTRMDKMVETNSGYFFGKLTWVDFFFVGIVESTIAMWGTDFLQSKYTHLHQLMQKVHSLPAIKAYITKRTDYDQRE